MNARSVPSRFVALFPLLGPFALAAAPFALKPLAAQVGLSAALDWSVDDRFGMDSDSDGRLDYWSYVRDAGQGVYKYAPQFGAKKIDPGTFKVHFDACASTGAIAEYRWRILGPGVDSGDQVRTQCGGFSYDLAEGTYTVSLTVRAQAGQLATTQKEVVVQDWLIVAIGDSFGSGEGAPEKTLFEVQLPGIEDLLSETFAAYEAWQDAAVELARRSQDVLAKARDLQQKLAALIDAERRLKDTIAKVQPALDALKDWKHDCIDDFGFSRCYDATKHLGAELSKLGLTKCSYSCIKQALLGIRDAAQAAYNLAWSAYRAAEQVYVTALAQLEVYRASVEDLKNAFTDLREQLDAVWQDPRECGGFAASDCCHRSSKSAQALAALAIEQADPRTSVTFVHLSCSGAQVKHLIDTRFKENLPQLVELKDLVGGREVDALLISIGGNDVQFGPMIEKCALQRACQSSSVPEEIQKSLIASICGPLGPFAPDCTSAITGFAAGDQAKIVTESAADLFEGMLPLLGGSYDKLACKLGEELPNLSADRVYMTEYPSAGTGSDGSYCSPSLGPLNFPGISSGEWAWAVGDMSARLNGTIAQKAEEHGWNFVDGVFEAFEGHGYCALDNWINRLENSILTQGDIPGTMHPNEAGYSAIAPNIVRELNEDFYAGGAPRAPRVWVSGKVTVEVAGGSAQPLEGVTLVFTRPDASEVARGTTSRCGDYRIGVPPGSSGTLTPFLEGYTFQPPSRGHGNLRASVSGQDYVATPRTISGRVRTPAGQGIPGVTVTFRESGGSATGSTVTAGDGTYVSPPLRIHWEGTATPSNLEYSFNPASRSYSPVTQSVSGEDYTAQNLPAISGRVAASVLGLKIPVEGAVVSFSEGAGRTRTDVWGQYRMLVPYGWSGSASVSKSDYNFRPTSRSYADLTTDRPGQDYDASYTQKIWYIYGYVHAADGTPISRVKMDFGSLVDPVHTDDTGFYGKSVFPFWTGTVSPSKPGYSFSPGSRRHSLVTSSERGDYTATPTPIEISGTVRGTGGQPRSGVTLLFSNAGTVATNATGSYRNLVPHGWSGEVRPSLAGHYFDPGARTYGALMGNRTSQDYVAVQIPRSISGRVRTAAGEGLAGAILTFTNGGGEAATDSSGSYRHALPHGWSGDVTVALEGYSLDPPTRSYTNLTADLEGHDYAATRLLGEVSGVVLDESGAPVSGVLVSFTNGGGTAETGATGRYSRQLPYGWQGTAVPSKAGFVFIPPSRAHDLKSNVLADDYTAIRPGITVTSPNGGETWVHEKVHAIEWTSVGDTGSHVRITLQRGEASTVVIASSTENDGHEELTVPASLAAGEDYRVQVRSTSISTYFDESDDDFAIEERCTVLIDEDFDDGSLEGTLLGSAWVLDLGDGRGPHLSLTQGQNGQSGVAWFEQPIDLEGGKLTVDFDFYLRRGVSAVPADGFSAVLQFGGDTSLAASTGGSLGTCFSPPRAYVSVAFDIWDNGETDPETPCDGVNQATCHVEVNQDICPSRDPSLATSIDFGVEIPDLVSLGTSLIPVHARLVLEGGILEVFLETPGDPTFAGLALKVLEAELGPLPANAAILGFAGSTGGANAHFEADDVLVCLYPSSSGFRRGEVNGDGLTDISDAVSLLAYLFTGGLAPGCDDAADSNDDGALDLSDSIFLLGYLFLGGPAPLPPFERCGMDTTEDSLGCAAFEGCGATGGE
ncbi:MAG: hypothetical protein HY721_05420 [Planctomycetes bacterium]|nr:hypothetical protein [Planctomycetota bacterium]